MNDRQSLSVSQLSAQIRQKLTTSFRDVVVAGELSNVSRPRSGHVYLTLKDAHAQIRGVIWRSTAERIRFEYGDGLEVVCQGDIDVYPPRGSYQLSIRKMRPLGEGALQLAYRQLFQRLSAEGLFDAELKRPLPRFPRRIGIVTSPSGAAVRDFLQVLQRRWRGASVLVVPARVQGDGAALEIAAAIEAANHVRPRLDVLVVGRGGGSLEDLWCFNEEPVVRAIYESRVPVVSAVGHEIDVTLADFAADVRALTPTEAAEHVSPDSAEIRAALLGAHRRMTALLRNRIATAENQLQALASRPALRRPLDRIHDLARQLDELQFRADRAVRNQIQRAEGQLANAAASLDALSPLAVLGRGYSITRKQDSSDPLHAAADVQPGDTIVTRLDDGSITSRVLPEDTDDD